MAIVSLLVAARSVSILGVHLSGRLICESYRTLNSYLTLCSSTWKNCARIVSNSLSFEVSIESIIL